MSQQEYLINFLKSQKTAQSLDQIMDYIENESDLGNPPRSTVRARLAELRLKDIIFQNPDDKSFSIKSMEQLQAQFATSRQCVNLIGIEIEGGWDSEPRGFYRDGSVSLSEECSVGEIQSTPSSIDDVKSWVTDNYPDYANKTCGMHIHLSFSNRLAYMQLLEKQFYDKVFLPNAEQWGIDNKINGWDIEDFDTRTKSGSEYWKRLAGRNSYCRKGYRGDKQARLQDKDSIRYYHLNYCWNLHNTLECRLFPTFKARDREDKPYLALSAIDFFYNVCNNYLASLKPEPRKVQTISVTVDEEIEESTICV